MSKITSYIKNLIQYTQLLDKLIIFIPCFPLEEDTCIYLS